MHVPKGRWICPLNTKPSADLLGVLLIQLADICHYILGSLLTLLSLDQSMCYYTTVLTLWDKPIFYLLSLVLSIFLPKSQRGYRFYSDFYRQTNKSEAFLQLTGSDSRHLDPTFRLFLFRSESWSHFISLFFFPKSLCYQGPSELSCSSLCNTQLLS